MKRMIICFAIAILNTNCASVVSRAIKDAGGSDEGPFMATQIDVAVAKACPEALPLVAVDLPFSLATDTVDLVTSWVPGSYE